ncbi:hypothetical protein PHYBLDRAFT_158199 [Phycomyces blakesleeanus NRRL 1555(-)]|uniref:Uncharacterized protein n=1 Tax=Phycomyces blakesleeanus (strain ATCC 8743b / DSM 1359 / FGSC 10004 / NBRC 33097 / NRRL 1555) TaxID=763407 RepID=A0A162Q0G9_PHYB8|nr:hypothetical protein PHYBLDRAFT_158199 [Phycomyces blakesleeanus NRRL 1555(-)]OAD76036.1 hypothetical protein PHYBLDRAFT_158199 [Phycomyces blakesleeanus NRRL 1555(-)]|eukprot:XP_018294076.1 hypothetical protein PHYBLDRAFT_158199 [Phycomyces blakesleeanus NRRL 1555(-)]
MTRASNYGYGRAKPAAQGGNNYSICLGLLCVGIFCKNALDAQNMEGVLGLAFVAYLKPSIASANHQSIKQCQADTAQRSRRLPSMAFFFKYPNIYML